MRKQFIVTTGYGLSNGFMARGLGSKIQHIIGALRDIIVFSKKSVKRIYQYIK